MHLAHAQSIAQEITNTLQPHCTKCFVAGSVRRQAPTVHDIEIVVEPIYHLNIDLFGQDVPGSRRCSLDFINAVHSLGKILKGSSQCGRYLCIDLKDHSIKLDLFIPQSADFFRQLAIRTGSADYVKYIAKAWKKKGWCGTPDGLRKINECTGGTGNWRCRISHATLPPVWQSEIDFFKWLAIPFLPPTERTHESWDKYLKA